MKNCQILSRFKKDHVKLQSSPENGCISQLLPPWNTIIIKKNSCQGICCRTNYHKYLKGTFRRTSIKIVLNILRLSMDVKTEEWRRTERISLALNLGVSTYQGKQIVQSNPEFTLEVQMSRLKRSYFQS